MKTNDLKKGDVVRLRNGWVAVIADNKKGNIRVATVYGTYTETGSVYSHDIVEKLEHRENGHISAGELALSTTGRPGLPAGVYVVHHIEHTPDQLKLKARTEEFGF